jgi:hypothetical protein
MNKHRTRLALMLGLASMPCIAAGTGYADAVEAYKADMKREDPHLINSGFIGNLASSQANRQVLQAARGIDGEPVAQEGRRGLRSAYGSGSTNSPIIYGTVRGDITIVTTRGGGRRGSVTTIGD